MALTPLTPLADILRGHTSSLTTEVILVGPSSPPIPLKLAQKIWRNEFIELHELLPARLGIPEPTLLDVLSQKVLRQQWALCFNSYITVLAMKQPQWLGVLLAYSSVIINARRMPTRAMVLCVCVSVIGARESGCVSELTS